MDNLKFRFKPKNIIKFKSKSSQKLLAYFGYKSIISQSNIINILTLILKLSSAFYMN